MTPARVTGRLTDACQRHAWPVVLGALLLAATCGWYTAGNLGMDTDTGNLFPDDLPWQRVSAEFDAAFPQNDDLLAVVVDASTPEQAEDAAAALAARLAEEPLVRTVRRPDGGDFFHLASCNGFEPNFDASKGGNQSTLNVSGKCD